MARVRKAKPEKLDGLSSEDIQKINRAVRQVWFWSHPCRLAKKRALHEDGFYRCENPNCEHIGKPVPKVYVDHVNPVGEIGGPGYIRRLFVPSSQLQVLCNQCHRKKTNEERKREKNVLETKEKPGEEIDFSGIHLP